MQKRTSPTKSTEAAAAEDEFSVLFNSFQQSGMTGVLSRNPMYLFKSKSNTLKLSYTVVLDVLSVPAGQGAREHFFRLHSELQSSTELA